MIGQANMEKLKLLVKPLLVFLALLVIAFPVVKLAIFWETLEAFSWYT